MCGYSIRIHGLCGLASEHKQKKKVEKLEGKSTSPCIPQLANRTEDGLRVWHSGKPITLSQTDEAALYQHSLAAAGV